MELIDFSAPVDIIEDAPRDGIKTFKQVVGHYEAVIRTDDGKVLHLWVPAANVTELAVAS